VRPSFEGEVRTVMKTLTESAMRCVQNEARANEAAFIDRCRGTFHEASAARGILLQTRRIELMLAPDGIGFENELVKRTFHDNESNDAAVCHSYTGAFLIENLNVM
jgi:hypothetical protein